MLKEERKDKKNQILFAAIRVFSRKGFYSSKIEEIAEEAGIGKGTVYEYFKSKQKLFEETLLTMHSIYLEGFDRMLSTRAKPREKMRSIFLYHFQTLLKHKEVAKIMMLEHPLLSDETMKSVIGTRDYIVLKIESIIEEGIETGEISVRDTWVASRIVACMMGFAADIIFNEKQQDDLEGLVDKVMDILWEGIAAKK